MAKLAVASTLPVLHGLELFGAFAASRYEQFGCLRVERIVQLPKSWLISVYLTHVAWLATANRTRESGTAKAAEMQLGKSLAAVTAWHHFVVK